MPTDNGLLSRIGRAFLLQASLIGIAALLSVYFAKIVLEEVLIKEAIEQEAEYYWKNVAPDEAWHLPRTLNLTGFSSVSDLPSGVRDMQLQTPGFYEYEDASTRLVIHVSRDAGKTLYLLYNRGQVDSLASYYGLFPLAVVLLVLYLSVWMTYTFSRRALSPVTRLARHVNSIDFNSSDYTFTGTEDNAIESNDDEIRVLALAIDDLGKRLEEYISRERNFTRDASHELRSPLTVINIAIDMLQAETLPDNALDKLNRIKRATSDMEELTEAFLLLARESESQLSVDDVCINDVIAEEIDRAMMINSDKAITIEFDPSLELTTQASDRVLSALFGNLIRNAFLYTDEGSIEILINEHDVIIRDSGEGMTREKVDEIFQPFTRGDNAKVAGYGVGLTIVKRLSDRFDWPISIDSTPGEGTSVTVSFPQSSSRPIK